MAASILGQPDVFLDLTPSIDSPPLSGTELVFWGEDPAAWHTCTISGVKIPGLSRIDGKGFDNRVDRQKIPGKNGQRLVHVGYDPADFVISTRIWTKAQLQSWFSVVGAVRPAKKGTPPTPVTISHPALTLWGVTSCLVLSGGFPKPNADDGAPVFYTIDLKCIEFVPPSSSGGTTSTAKYDVGKFLPGSALEAELRKQQSPATQNTGPSASFPDAPDNNGTTSFQPPKPPPPFTPGQ